MVNNDLLTVANLLASAALGPEETTLDGQMYAILAIDAATHCATLPTPDAREQGKDTRTSNFCSSTQASKRRLYAESAAMPMVSLLRCMWHGIKIGE